MPTLLAVPCAHLQIEVLRRPVEFAHAAKHPDQKVARLHLDALGVKISELIWGRRTTWACLDGVGPETHFQS
jgi:hypothetical protein